MRVGELIPLKGSNFMSKTSVPAGKAATAEFGVLGITVSMASPDGETSRPAFKMPKYKAIRGQTQGTK